MKKRYSLWMMQFQNRLGTPEAASGEEKEGGSDGKTLKHEWVVWTWTQWM